MSKDSLGTVARAIHVLRFLAEAPGDITITEMSQKLGLAPSTTHRLLDLLGAEGLVERDPKLRRYRTGPEYFRLSALVTAKVHTTDLAKSTLQRLCNASAETCVLALYNPTEQSYFFAAKVESENPLRYRIDLYEPRPLIWGASGRIILAYLDETTISEITDKAKSSPISGASPPTMKELKQTLHNIRRLGYATSRSESTAGATSIAAPIFDRENHVVGSLNITIPEIRVKQDHLEALAPLILKEAAALSKILGYRGPQGKNKRLRT